MKESKYILNQRIALSFFLQAAIVTLIALPELDPYRAQLSELSTLPEKYFWIPLLILMLLLQMPILSGIGTKVVDPLEELVNQTKLGANSIAFKKKSQNSEEDHLKHFIESQALRAIDLEAEVNRLEGEIERINQVAETPPEEIDEMREKIAKADQTKAALQNTIAEEKSKTEEQEKRGNELRRQLKATKLELETVLFNQRRSRMEPAELESEVLPSESVQPTEFDETLPTSLVEKLLTPLNLIHNLSWRLAKAWAETPPAQIREGLEEISMQSENQIALLKQHRAKVIEE
ncbi:hypothetical protein [Pelagicoccus sp. SDUM812002]|uniref:hypothetical protein n=1 Tax=Pelagicoccus sp. SDUM812002 TaxID=3041266 RepID=UPI00280F9924|nr:hypothetical protein [Pelagicoccus sp. SDUM812002]MDQ8184887.1 hypothetical protein [Pelagicoccus sp. SDUM812002]